MEEIVNKVANSGLVTIDLESWIATDLCKSVDIAPQLWQGVALREKDFRAFVQSHDWSEFQGVHVAVFCSADAIVPQWAYMLVASALTRAGALSAMQSTPDELAQWLLLQRIQTLDANEYADRRIIVKGCSKKSIPPSAYTLLVSKLQPVVKSIMFGEPCSTVPVFKAAASVHASPSSEKE
jgi:Protein of unknown function (DUF2480)